MTLLPSYGATTTISSGNVTLYSAAGELGYFSSNYIELYGNTNTISTSEGTITKIVFNGYDTRYPVSRLSTTTGNYTYSNNVGTWTGDATSVTFSASGYVDVSSIVVTVTTGGDTPTEGKIYEKVTSPSQLVAGKKYILVYETTPAVMGAITTTGTKYGLSITGATIDGNTINTSGANGVAELTLGGSTDAWTFDMGNGAYLYWNSGNTLTTNSDATNTQAQWIATSKGDGYVLTNKNTNERVLQYNSNSGQERFACYATTQKDAFLYVEKTGGDTPQPGVEGGLLRLHLLMVDQLKAAIPDDNSHPDGYGYVLRFEPEGGDTKESASVKVDIQKTGCEVKGYYSLDEIDHDTNIGINHDEGIVMDVMTADVKFDLSSDNGLIDSYILDGKANDEEYFYGMTKLEQTTDFSYIEMLEGPDKGHKYPSGEHHYYDQNYKLGIYGESFMSYAPSVSTWGIERRYFEEDGLDNTYGAPIWKTAVGDVILRSATARRQIGWNTSWKDGDTDCRLYMLDNIEAWGFLPSKEKATVEYEPYMFRVFVESKNGKLRNYKYETVTDEDGKTREVIVADETSEAQQKEPLCVWSAYVNTYNDADLNAINEACNNQFNDGTTDYDILFKKNRVMRDAPENEDDPLPAWDKDEENAIFGVVDNLTTVMQEGKEVINPNDLTIFVRFYYIVKGMSQGWKPWNPNRATGDDPAGYGAESPGTSPEPATAVSEIAYHGEVVGQTYYNIQGMESDKPFDGVNIVVTRYSDGATSISKVIR